MNKRQVKKHQAIALGSTVAVFGIGIEVGREIADVLPRVWVTVSALALVWAGLTLNIVAARVYNE